MKNKPSINDIFKMHRTDKYFHEYGRMYEEFVSPSNIKSLLEIGVKKGCSLSAWRDILPTADLYGMDISDEEWIADRITHSKAKTFIADSTDKRAAGLISKVDLIIDDGSHYPDDQLKTLENFKNKFNKYYVIEDVVANLYDVLTGVKNLGFDDFYVYRSQDIRGKMKGLENYFARRNQTYIVEEKRKEYVTYIYCVIIRK